jgi:hypothetical protein
MAAEDTDDTVYPVLCIMPHYRFSVLNCVDNTLRSMSSDHKIAESKQLVKVIDDMQRTHSLSLDEVGNMFGFEYSPHLQFLHEGDFRNSFLWSIETEGIEYKVNIPLSIVKQLVASYYIHPSVFLMHVGVLDGADVGYGMFADEDIISESILGEYTGIVSANSQATAYSLNYPSAIGGQEVDASTVGNLIRFINHSCTPNASFRIVKFDSISHVLCVSNIKNSELRSVIHIYILGH